MTVNIEILRDIKLYNQDYHIHDIETLAIDIISKKWKSCYLAREF